MPLTPLAGIIVFAIAAVCAVVAMWNPNKEKTK